MKRLLLLAALPLLLASCGVCRRAPESNTKIRYVDSLVLRDSIVYVELPKEKDAAVARLSDTLHMETSIAKAEAYVDTATNSLRGKLVNKEIPLERVVHFAEKYRIRDSTVIRWQFLEVKTPIEVVPWHYWLWFATSLISILYIFAKVILRLRI